MTGNGIKARLSGLRIVCRMLNDDGMPKDPFNTETPDLTQWASHCRSMYLSLVASEFTESQSLEFTIRVMTAMLVAKAGS